MAAVTPDPQGPSSPVPLRIGHGERAAAQQRLDAHLEAGRLDIDEYVDRFARAGIARNAVELDVLFTDLPGGWRAQPAPPAPAVIRHSAGRTVLAELSRVPRPALIPLAVFVALTAFSVVHIWVWFMLIPATAVWVGRSHERRHRYPPQRRRRY